TLVARKADAGTMVCRLMDTTVELEVPLARGAAGSLIQIAIRAGDILLATEPPRGLSARNILRGRLVSLTRDGAAMVAAVEAGAGEHDEQRRRTRRHPRGRDRAADS